MSYWKIRHLLESNIKRSEKISKTPHNMIIGHV